MGWQPGPGDAAGASPDRGAGVPGGAPPMRDPRLALFGGDGLDQSPAPSGALALLADELSGPGRRCPGATGNELAGLLRAWAAIESWAAGSKLAVIRELIRRDDPPPGAGRHGDLPDAWSPSLRHELAAALSCSAQSAETTVWLAWEQQARLPGTGALLRDGTLTYAKARAVTETFKYLSDADAARAEALITGQLAGKTYPQVLRLAEHAALTVDPELAERRREQAERKDARVTLFREQQGTAGLSGRDLPPDEALAAMASVNARAQDYEDCGAFGATRMDVLRAYAYLDLLNGVTTDARIACAEAQDEAAEAAEAMAWAEARAARNAAGAQAGTGAEGEAGAGATPATDANAPASGTGAGGDAATGTPPATGTAAPGRTAPARTRARATARAATAMAAARRAAAATIPPATVAAAPLATARTPASAAATPLAPAAAGATVTTTSRATTMPTPTTVMEDQEEETPALAVAGLAVPPPGRVSARRAGRSSGARLTWSSRWRRCSAWPGGPARSRASARSTPPWPAGWPPPRPPAPAPRYASQSPAPRATPPATAAPGQSRHADEPANPVRPRPAPPPPGSPPASTSPSRPPPCPASPAAPATTAPGRSPRAAARPQQTRQARGRPAGRARRTATAPGRSPPLAAGSSLCASARSPPTLATTATRPPPTSQATSSATWSRSATAPAPSRPAIATQETPTSSTPSRMTRAAGPAPATPAHAPAPATASSNPRGGHPAQTRLAPMADPSRPRLRPRTLAIPSLTGCPPLAKSR